MSDLSSTVRLSDGILARLADQTTMDSMRGTYVWSGHGPECPSGLVQLYRGPMKFYVNSTASVSLKGSLAVLEREDQVAGLELTESFPLCHQAALEVCRIL